MVKAMIQPCLGMLYLAIVGQIRKKEWGEHYGDSRYVEMRGRDLTQGYENGARTMCETLWGCYILYLERD